MKSWVLLSSVLVVWLFIFVIAGCASTSEDELAKQRAETLRKERELQRQMRERMRLEAQRREQEEQEKAQTPAETKQDYLKIVETLKASSQPLSAIAISPDGKLLACGTARGQLKVFETGGGIKAAAAEHNEAIRAIAFLHDSSCLYTGGADETLAIWDMSTGKAKKKIHDFFMAVGGVAASADGTFIAAGDGKKLFLLDKEGAIKKELKSKAYGITSVRVVPGDQRIATGSKGGLVEIWETGATRPQYSMRRHSGTISCLTVGSSGKSMLSGGSDKLIVLWDIEKGKAVRVYEGHRDAVSGVQFISGTTHFVSSDQSGWLYVWDTATSRIIAKMQVCESGSVAALVLSPDGKRLYAALSDGTVTIIEFIGKK